MAYASFGNKDFHILLVVIFVITIIVLAIVPSGLLTVGGGTKATGGTGDKIAPSVLFEISPASPIAGQTVTFTAAASDETDLSAIDIVYGVSPGITDDQKVQSCPASGTAGTCIFKTTYSTPGIYYIYATARDKAGNSGYYPITMKLGAQTYFDKAHQWSFVVESADPIPPTVTLDVSSGSTTTPSSYFPITFTVVAGNVVTFTATASDNIQVSRIEINHVDENGLSQSHTCPINNVKGTCVFKKTYSSPGTYSFYAHAIDSALNDNTAPNIMMAQSFEPKYQNKLVVLNPDSIPPVLTLAYSPQNPVSGQPVQIIATVTDENPLPDFTVSFYSDGSLVSGGAGYRTPDNKKQNWFLRIPSYSAGTHTIKATAKDIAGNSAPEAKQTFSVTPDTTPPADKTAPNIISHLYSPAARALSLGGQPAFPIIVGPQAITFNLGASDATAISKIDFYLDENIVQNACGAPGVASGACTYSAANLGIGLHSYRFLVYDAAGNVNEAFKAYGSFEIVPADADINMPALSVTSSPATPTAGRPVIITANAADDKGLSKIEIYFDGALDTVCSVPANTKEYSCADSITTTATGVHTYKAIAYDTSGNRISAPAKETKSFTVIGADTVPPTLSVNIEPPNPVSGQWVTVTAIANDIVEVKGVSLFYGRKNVPEDMTSAWKTCTPAPGSKLAICQYKIIPNTGDTYKATAIDVAGNRISEPATGSKSFTVSPRPVTTKPPTIIVSHTPASPVLTQPVTIHAESFDKDGVGVIDILVDGVSTGVKTGYATNKHAGADFTTAFSKPGQHNYEAIASNIHFQKTSSGKKSFTVIPPAETIPPTLTFTMTPESPTYVRLAASARDNAGVASVDIYLDGVVIKTCTGAYASGCSIGQTVSTGTHTYKAVAIDTSYNKAYSPGPTDKETTSFTVPMTVSTDTTPPTATVAISPAAPKAGETVTLTVTANDNSALSTIKIYADLVLVGTPCTVSGTSAICTRTTSFSTAGSHYYSASATDAANNMASATPSTGSNVITVSST